MTFLGSRGFSPAPRFRHDGSQSTERQLQQEALDKVTVDAPAKPKPAKLEQSKDPEQAPAADRLEAAAQQAEALVKKLEQRAYPPVDNHLEVRTDSGDKRRAMWGHWLQHAAGGEKTLAFGGKLDIDMQAVAQANDGGASLMAMATEFAREKLGREPTGRAEVFRHSFVSTGDFPLILEDTLNKRLASMYEQVTPTWTAVARQTSANDFRTMDVNFGDATPKLEEVIEGAEVRYEGGTEAQESYRVKTYAKAFRVTRQMVINDDLSFLSRKPNEYARAGISLENELVWGQIVGPAFNNANIPQVQGAPLFSTARDTLGSSDDLTEANIATAMEVMAKRRDRNGNTILGMQYMTLVVPANLRLAASKLLELNNYAPDQVDRVVPNYVRNLNLVMEPLLPDDKWYLFAAPGMVDIAEIAFLRGSSSPSVMTEQTTNIMGVEYMAVHDVGAKVVDYYGVYRSS